MKQVKYDDIYEHIRIKEAAGDKEYYGKYYPQQIKIKNKFWKRCIKYFANKYSDFIISKNQTRGVLILDTRFTRVINALKNDYSVIIVKNSFCIDFVNWIKQGVAVYYVYNWQKKIDTGFLKKSILYASQTIDEMENYMKKNKIRILIMGNDRTFLERSLAIAANNLNIPVVIVQHCMPACQMSRNDRIGAYADYFFVWSDYVKQLYENTHSVNKDFVKVVGYPYYVKKISPANNRKILFLGKGYYLSNEEKGYQFEKVVRCVYEICMRNGWEFSYRMHPIERKKDVLSKYQDCSGFRISTTKNLINDAESARVVIGDVSTSFIELALSGINAVQIVWNREIESYLVEEYSGYTYHVPFNEQNIEEIITKFINNEVKFASIKKEYIWNNKNFEQSILTEINNIVGDKE